jgi:hypothetical protein
VASQSARALMMNRTALSTSRLASEDGHVRLLAAAPILAVSDELARHVSDLARLAPSSDATTALTLYRDKLQSALMRARQLDLFISAETASVVLGKSVSMVTHLCRTGALSAKKVGGTWQIDRLALERMRPRPSIGDASTVAARAD